MRIDQQSQNAVLNWRSFNIGPDGSVQFVQPNSSAVALNQIFQQDPSRILGALSANGQVYLINTNGIVFGSGAKVNVGGLVASSLGITQQALDDGIARAVVSGAPAFRAAVDSQGRPLAGSVTVEAGATLEAKGGQVLLLAPQVTNEGVIRTPDGQTILAAGSAVYLAPSSDANLRGLLVQVEAGGTVVNGNENNRSIANPEQLAGQIVSERGNVTLAGLVVKQLGHVKATTSARINGSVQLQAADGVEILPGPGGSQILQATQGGKLIVGQNAATEVVPDADVTSKQVDVSAQPRSSILMQGREVALLSGSRTVATGGNVSIFAQSDPRVPAESISSQPDGSRLFVDSGAVVDVSGSNIELGMESNLLRVELRGSQLADSPLQRDGALRGETVYVDVRRSGTRPDGTTWVGSPIGNLAGDIAGIGRTIGERSLAGGSIRLQSQGAVLVSRGATLDVSGGSIRYRDGYLNTTQLVTADGRPVDIANADPLVKYLGITTAFTVTDSRWGVTRTFPTFARDPRGVFEHGYIEGKDAGSVTVVAPGVVLDGNVAANVVRGPYQRRPQTTVPAGSLYRPFDQAPLGGALTVGNTVTLPGLPNRVVNDVTFGTGFVLDQLRNADGSAFDPMEDPLPESLARVLLRTSLTGPGGPTRLTVRANGEIRIADGQSLQVAQGGRVDLAAGRIYVDGDIDAPSGAISLVAEPTVATDLGESVLHVGSTSALTARGAWVNDNPAVLGAQQTAPLFTSGGTVSLLARQGSLEFAAGGLIDVSGGAWLDGSGRLRAGTGGNVSIGNTPITEQALPAPIVVAGDIRGHSLDRGGRLVITAGSICISNLDCNGPVDQLQVAPSLLADAGFGSYSLLSNRGGLVLTDGTTLTLRQQNLQLLAGAENAASATDVLALARLTQLDPLVRRPVSLTLATNINTGGNSYTNASFSAAPGLIIGSGSLIDTDAGATVDISSNSWMHVDGTIFAPAGNINLTLTPTLNVAGFLDAQAIWLGEHSRLVADGTALIETNDRGQRSGTVLDAGAVTVRAQRGYLITLPGSYIGASGTAATLDLRTVAGSAATTPTTVASSAGSISLIASEGMLLNGELRAAAGEGRGAAGGTLAVSLDTSSRNDPGALQSLFPLGERVVTLAATPTAVVVPVNAAVPRNFNGTARIDSATVAQGGFDSLFVSASETFGRISGPQVLASVGRVATDGDVHFVLRDRFGLDAAVIGGGSGLLRIDAAYATLGNSSTLNQVRSISAGSGSAALRVDAGLIDLVGNFALQGISRADFSSTGDIRMRGVQALGGRTLTGSMVAAGNLYFQADQLYPTTLTDFQIGVVSNPDGRIEVLPGGDRGPVYSAGGRLQFTAQTIRNSGAVVAPFGSIVMRGDTVELAPGSLTATTGAGRMIPFGETQGGFDWTVGLRDGVTLVVGNGGFRLPAQELLLDGRAIALDQGATIDAAGGGDLVAYEWVPGVGGTRDLLSPLQRPDQYVILPTDSLASSPIDPSWGRDSNLRPGAAVYLDGVPGLPSGEYALLPARYALLPGAYLVSAVGGYQDIVPGESHRLADGSTVVAGYRTVLGTDLGGSRYSGFAVRQGSAIQAEAAYTLTGANKYFANRDAAGVGRLPVDAGLIGLVAREQLGLAARLISQPGTGGRGVGIDISAQRLRVGAAGTVAAPDELVLNADALAALGAESLLIGGRRSLDAGIQSIDSGASSVGIDAGVELSVPELLLVATDRIDIGDGAKLEGGQDTATAATDENERIRLLGDGAFVRVAAGAQADVDRTGGAGGLIGSVAIGANAVLGTSTGGSIAIDATSDVTSRGRFEVPEGSLSLGSSRISLGDVTQPVQGLVLTNEQLGRLGASELILRSRTTIDLYGPVSLSADSLQLLGGGLRAASGNVAAVLEGRQTVLLANPTNVATGAPNAGSGTLDIRGREVQFGAGQYVFDSFATARVSAQHDIISVDSGTILVGGDFALDAARITGRTGVERGISVEGDVTIGPSSVAPTAAATASEPQLGAVLRVDAASIVHAGVIEMRAGRVELVADGAGTGDGVTLADGSVIDVSGTLIDFDGVAIAAPAGNVTLSAANGSVTASSSSRIDVRAASTGEPGAIRVRAANGTIDLRGDLFGNSGTAGAGGRVQLDGASIEDFSGLNARLNSGGFDSAREFRIRAGGSLELGAADAIRARDVVLTADAGSVRIAGRIDARGADGGRIVLNARDVVAVDGTLDASATSDRGAGGSVLLNAVSGSSGLGSLGGTASIDVSAGKLADAADAGEIAVRLDRQRLGITNGQVDGLSWEGSVLGTSLVKLEAVQHYLAANGRIDSSNTAASPANPWFADAANFMANAPALNAALGGGFDIRPGVEVEAPGDLVLAADWNLYNWRFNGAPGILTLRAGGDLRVDRSLSDGFASVDSLVLPEIQGESWSYRLVAGANLASADPLSVKSLAELPSTTGSMLLAPGDFLSTDPFSFSDFRMIRTGTGEITIRAARDVLLGNQASVIYAAGVSGPGIRLPDEFEGLRNLPYPTGGGDIDIATGGSVRGAISSQLFTDWMWRVGAPFSNPTAWTVNFERFEQGVLSIGGNVAIRAEGNVENLSVSVPVIGRQVGGLGPTQNAVELAEGGSLTVRAEGSILGGTFLVGNGVGRFVAGDDIGTATLQQDPNRRALDPLFALMGRASLELEARRDVRVESVVNPTLLPQGVSQNAFDRSTYFSTYDPDSSVRLTSTAGDIVLRGDVGVTVRSFPTLAAQTGDEIALRVLPPSLTAVSISRDVELLGPLTLFPAPKGNLQILAGRDVTGTSTDPVQIMLSDADPEYLPTVLRPQATTQRLVEVLATPLTQSSNLHAVIPVHALSRQPDGIADDEPVRIVARTGDIRISTDRTDDSSGFYLAKRARFIAGGDIRELAFNVQHLSATDVTTVRASGDITYRLARTAFGGVSDTRREMIVDGPGRLELIAGGDLNLQTSGGITTRGNLRVPGLPDVGASVSVLVGVRSRGPDYDAFLQRYVVEGKDYDKALELFVAAVTGEVPENKAEALMSFEALSESLRSAFLQSVYFAELRDAGRAAAASTNADYSRGFEAIETLFPGGNPDPDAGEVNAYDGDIQMYFSRIYTLDGGDILLLAPGGEVNVGLATPPASFGLQKGASQLGLVAQSVGSIASYSFADFAVNESRVFAADGGNILVWSTRGDIDAGRGAKTALSAPPPIITFDANGTPQVTFPAALSGSGIQTIATTLGRKPGDVDLYAPRGIVNAGDAGIVAGNLTIGATAVLGADNIQVTGVSVGVPVDTGGLGAGFAGVSSVSASASQSAVDSVSGAADSQSGSGSGDAALSWLDVFVVGLGDESCDPKDLDCIRRQKK